MNHKIALEMVQQFQCPGCTLGSDIKCGHFKLQQDDEMGRCESHSAWTLAGGAGWINLGLPKGFNRVTKRRDGPTTNIWLSPGPRLANHDQLNVAVWAMEQDGYLFVRCYRPRVDDACVYVYLGGKLSDLPEGTIDVSKFINGID